MDSSLQMCTDSPAKKFHPFSSLVQLRMRSVLTLFNPALEELLAAAHACVLSNTQ
jgi:hypothetical protein